MAGSERLVLRLKPDDKRLNQAAAAVVGASVSSSVRAALAGEAARPVGGWSFELPEGWDAPHDDFAPYR